MRVATEQRESADERHLSAQPPARLGGTDLFRGAMVILAAVVIGGLVLSRGIDDDEVDTGGAIDETEQAEVDPAAVDATDTTNPTDQAGAEAATDAPDQGVTSTLPTTAPTATAEDPVSDETTETTTTPLDTVRAPAEVRTLVLNAGGPQGIAGRATELLQAASYTTAAAKNADANGPSAIYFIEGYEAEALAAASVFGPGLDALVEPLDPVSPPTADIQDAVVIIVVGNDDIIAVP